MIRTRGKWEGTATMIAWNYWRTKIMRWANTIQVLLLSMFALFLASSAGAQSTRDAAPSVGSAGSGSGERTEQQEMRDELKALREEVERLRLEVEHNKSAETTGEHVAVAPAAPANSSAPSEEAAPKPPAISRVPAGTTPEQ